MKYYLVVDTNVIVSAFISKHSNTATVQLLHLLLSDNRLKLIVNDAILQEYYEVTHRPKFNLDISMVDAVLDKLAEIAENVPGETFEGCLPDPKDIMFVEVAQSIPGSNIVTGNVKHFPGIQNIMTPTDFLSYFKQKESL